MKFSVEDIRLLDDSQVDKSQFSLLRVDAFATGESLHKTFVTEETLRRTAKTILQKPFVFAIDKRFDDLSSHVPEELPAGFVPHNSRLEFRELPDGRLMLSCDVLIWKRYSNNLIEYFKRDGGKKGVSVEVEIFDSKEDEKSGLLELIDFCFTAITGLGDMIQPAIPNANAVLAFSKEYDEVYELEFGKYDDLNFKIPQNVKSAAKQGLELRSKYGRGGTSVGLATARYLVKNDAATPEKVRHVAKYFPRHAGDNLDDKESNGWIAWLLWGGDAGRRWSTSLVKKMDELDERKMSYFGEEERVPYKSLEDANSAIKGIEPSVSLSQANEIAKQADAIGSDDNKNGWAIAISNFKKSHTVKDGKWVKKDGENFSEDNYLGIENFSYNSSQIIEIINSSLSEFKWEGGFRKYWVESFDETYAYIRDNEDDKYYRVPYQLDGGVCLCDLNNKETVIRGGFELIMANEDEKKFNYAEIFADEKFAQMFAEVEEDMEEEEREEDEKEKYAKAKEEFGVGMNPSAVMSAMYSAMKRMGKRFSAMKEKMAAMDEDKKVYLAENAEMKQRFAEQEEQAKQMSVDSFMKEMSDKVEMSAEQVEEMKEKSKEYSFADIEKWKNHVKAFAFDFKPKAPKEKDKSIVTYALPFNNFETPQTTNVWDNLSK